MLVTDVTSNYFTNISKNPLNLTPKANLESIINIGQVDSTELAEFAEPSENHNFHSSLIKQPKNYP